MIRSGIFLTILIFIPNLLFVFLPPKGARPVPVKSLFYRIMTVLEQIGRAGVLFIPLFYPVRMESNQGKIAAAVCFTLICLYYFGWVRYIIKGRELKLLYRPFFLNIPVPMAIFPIGAFISGSIILKSWPLFIMSVVFAIGHIFITCRDSAKIL